MTDQPTPQWTTDRWLRDQAEIPAEFTDHQLLRAITIHTRLTAERANGTKVAALWTAVGVWVIALAVLAGLLGIVTVEFRPL